MLSTYMHIQSCANFKAWQLELDAQDDAIDIESDVSEKDSERDNLESSRKRRRTDGSSCLRDDHESSEETFPGADHMDDVPAEFIEGSSKDGLPMENSDAVVHSSFGFYLIVVNNTI